MAIATALLILLLAAPTVYGVQHIVGDASGWSTSVDYDSWAASNTFTVGDTLGNHMLFITHDFSFNAIKYGAHRHLNMFL